MFVPYQEYKLPYSYKDSGFVKKPYLNNFETQISYQRKIIDDAPSTKPLYHNYTQKAHNWNPNYEKYAHILPVPNGSTAYAQAKRSEYVEKNLWKAELYYRMAIELGERVESAIKDLATVLHQQGKTEEACKFLEEHKHLITKNEDKFENLLTNLRKQIVPSGNYGNRILVLFNVSGSTDDVKIRNLFGNGSRITHMQFKWDEEVDMVLEDYEDADKPKIIVKRMCLLHFSSNSAARKTLESLRDQHAVFYWMNIDGRLTGRAEGFKKIKETKARKQMSSETEGNSFMSTSTKDSSPKLSVDQNRNVEPIGRTRKESFNCSSPCWKNLVFPTIPGDNEDDTSSPIFDDFVLEDGVWASRQQQSSKHQLWNQMASKQKETKKMISNDPDFVKKLLRKVVSDVESKSATISYSDSVKNHHHGNRVLVI